MRLSKRMLEEIIVEELNSYLSEVATCHSKATGYFDKCKKGNVYSLTHDAATKNKIDKKYVQRGIVSSEKDEEDEPPKISAKFGMNTSDKKAAGRKKISGKDINPKYSVSKYPEKYTEAKGQKFNPEWESQKKIRRQRRIQKPARKSWVHGYDELDRLARGYLSENPIGLDDLLEIVGEAFATTQELEEASRNKLAQKCKSIGLISMGDAQKRILLSLNNFAKAHDGKLGQAEG